MIRVYLLSFTLVAALAVGCRQSSELSESSGSGNDGQSEQAREGLIQKVNLVVENWSNLKATAQLDRESIRSWLPDRGIRGRYQIVKQVIAKATIENLVGEKVFLNGPHENSINFNSAKEFGRYNPDFLTKLRELLADTFANETFVVNAQGLYDSQLKRYLRTYYLSYDVAANNKLVMDGYLSAIESETASSTEGFGSNAPSVFLQESFRDFAESSEKDGYDVYEAFTCPGFWVRRSIGGTADEFYDLLKLTLQTFDKQFLEEQTVLKRDQE